MTNQTEADAAWTDRQWESADGLKLHYRDYPGEPGLAPVLCLHGLTRNARDFAVLAERIAPSRRVIVPEMRGRGMSDYAKDSASYNAAQYVADVELLLGELQFDRFIAIGTSLGGIMTMMLAAAGAERIVAAVLNDIGPVIEPRGLETIRGYVGQGRSFQTWMHAARALREVHQRAYPRFGIEDWLAMAKRVMVLGQGGRIVFDYDMAIAEPFNTAPANAAPADLWAAYSALAGIPQVLVRGAQSDILSEATAREMKARSERLTLVTVPDTGHAPLLTQPDVLAAIDALLAGAG
ncbi:alpha/beta hydrolase [Parerythrobacter aurantius]|uniref:alpha/beta fold hydrolase n=1 Tax=Parerythrobacter aurantius TaxID=3127706 RepID=UPI00324426A6